MKIRRIADYFPNAQTAQPAQQIEEQTTAPQAKVASEEAVRISRGARVGDDSAAAAGGRADTVARLSEQVRSGSYRPDSKVVAEALYKELF